MLLSSLLVSVVALWTGATLAAPLDAVQMGSKHNLYLSTCTRRTVPSCPLIIICKKAEEAATTFTAAAYYANGPSNGAPSELATVSETAQPWEGTLRVANFRTSAFSSNIAANADTLAKSAIAGDAKLGNEEFACFKDGDTTFSVSQRDAQISCEANYWCASLSV